MSSDLKRPAGLMGDIYDELRKRLAGEPCVLKRDDMADSLREAPAKLRRGLTPKMINYINTPLVRDASCRTRWPPASATACS